MPGRGLPLDAGPAFISYSWNTGDVSQNIIAENAGIYFVSVVDKNHCRATDSVSLISILQATPINLGADTMICPGEKILLDAGGGFVNYQWNTGETTQQIYVTEKGNYWIEANNNNNCISRDSFSVLKINDLPVINLDKNPSLCSGNSRTLDAGSGVNYLWQDGSTKSTLEVTGAGKYRVRVTSSAGCIATDSTEIKDILPLPSNFIYHDTAICEALDITLSPSKQFVNYLWSNGRTSGSINITSAGQYWLQVTDADGCLAKEYINVTSKIA